MSPLPLISGESSPDLSEITREPTLLLPARRVHHHSGVVRALRRSCAGVALQQLQRKRHIVNGFQDDFDGTELSPDWLLYDGGLDDPPAELFAKSGTGTLLMNPSNGDPNKLLYNPATPYSDVIQEVVALIRLVIDPDLDTDGSAAASTSRQILVTDRNQPPFPRAKPERERQSFQPPRRPTRVGAGYRSEHRRRYLGGRRYKWLRLQQARTPPEHREFRESLGRRDRPEPVNFDLSWSNRARAGLAGLTTNSIGGQAVLEVDYVLIKAEGLPPTTVAVPEPGSALLVGLAGGLLGLRRRREGLTR